MVEPLKKYYDFCHAFSPVLLCHLLVPTYNESLERHFVYSKEALRQGRWWTAVTYMFCHADASHLASNAQGLLMAGPSAVEVLGPGALVTYVTAGVVGALDLAKLYDLQLERYFTRGFRAARDVLPTASLAVTRVLDDATSWLASSLATDLSAGRRLLGASAGVSAFVALDACLAVEKCVRGDGGLALAFNALSAARYFSNEANRTWTGAAPGIDHAAHLNGAVVGIAAFVIARAFQAWKRRRRPSSRHTKHGPAQ